MKRIEKNNKAAVKCLKMNYTKIESTNNINHDRYKEYEEKYHYLQNKDGNARERRWRLADENGTLIEENKRLMQENSQLKRMLECMKEPDWA